MTTVADVVAWLSRRYPPDWAEDWDRVGLVLGEPDAPVRRILLAVDCVPETVEEAVAAGADLMVTHHPLLLRGVSSVAPVTYKGRIVHRMIRAGVALFAAHTNADVAAPGVSDALAARLGLTDLRPLRPAEGAVAAAGAGAAGGGAAAGPARGSGRIGRLPAPVTLRELTHRVAAALPATVWGVRAAGDPDRIISTLAVCGGSGDTYLADAAVAGADAYLTADLRHHPASEYVAEGGPALLDAAHWATERPWLDELATVLPAAADGELEIVVSDLVTDPWTGHAQAPGADRPARPGDPQLPKESRP